MISRIFSASLLPFRIVVFLVEDDEAVTSAMLCDWVALVLTHISMAMQYSLLKKSSSVLARLLSYRKV